MGDGSDRLRVLLAIATDGSTLTIAAGHGRDRGDAPAAEQRMPGVRSPCSW